MNYFKSLKIVLESFPEFNPENEQDLIKVEKILKAEQKVNQNFSNQDIEEVIHFYKTYGNHFQVFLTDKKFMNVFLNDYHKIYRYSFILSEENTKKLHEFGNIFEKQIQTVINKHFHKSFLNLEYLILQYRPAINIHNEEFIANLFSDKLKIIGNNLQNGNYRIFYSGYSFAFNSDFYRCISTFNAELFEKDILKLSRFGEKESIDKKEKIVIGKILDALSFFKSSNPEINQYLQNKKNFAILLRKDEETLFSKLEERLQNNWVEKEDSWKDVFLPVFFMILFVGTFVLIYLYLPIFVFGFEFLLTVILFFAFLGAPNNWGVAEYDTSKYSFLKQFKKFSLSLYIIFRYILFVLIIGNIFIGIIAFLAYMTSR